MANRAKISVLVVDDNEVMRAVLRTILRDDDCDVIGEASSGVQALETALRLKPDLICLDVVMPKGDGLEILDQLRSQLPRTAVLMVTSSADRDTVQTAIDRGAAGYILKPFNAARVIEAAHAAVAKVRRG